MKNSDWSAQILQGFTGQMKRWVTLSMCILRRSIYSFLTCSKFKEWVDQSLGVVCNFWLLWCNCQTVLKMATMRMTVAPRYVWKPLSIWNKQFSNLKKCVFTVKHIIKTLFVCTLNFAMACFWFESAIKFWHEGKEVVLFLHWK